MTTFSRTASDTGLTIVESIQKSATKLISTTGLTVTDSIQHFHMTGIVDTGLTITDSIARAPISFVRTLADNGMQTIFVDPGGMDWIGLSGTSDNVPDGVYWYIRIYDLNGNPIAVTDMKGINAPSNNLLYVDDKALSYPNNGFDQFTGKVMLLDPAAQAIQKKKCVLKVWRTINDPVRGVLKPYVMQTPDFGGPVISTNVRGEDGYKTFTAINPLWRTQNRFHVNNHHLQDDTHLTPDYPAPYQLTANGDKQPFDASALMYRMIALAQARNTPFQRVDMGVRKPLTRDYSGTPGTFQGTGMGNDFWPKTISVAPYFISKGSNVWSEVYQDIMQRVEHPDIHPEYIHFDGRRELMYFKTEVVRGDDKSATISFDYHTGQHNLADIEVDETLQPGQYGNFVWVTGDGGPNVYLAEDLDYNDEMEFGSYMMDVEVPGALEADLNPIAPAELAIGKLGDAPVFQLTHLPSGGGRPYYDVDFTLGDVVTMNAVKEQWSISGVKQRIYQVDVNMDRDNSETVQVLVALDYLGQIVDPSTGTPQLTAQFTSSPDFPTTTDPVTFTDTSVPGLSGPITKWYWDFGDGTQYTGQFPPDHTYAADGLYMVTLQVTGTGTDGTSEYVGLVAVLG